MFTMIYICIYIAVILKHVVHCRERALSNAVINCARYVVITSTCQLSNRTIPERAKLFQLTDG
jgi:hypothetical protein